MKKELPNVFVNPLDKDINNTQEYFYSEKNLEERSSDINSVLTKINRIFNSPYHVYKSRVKITTRSGIFESDIVGKSNGKLLTLNGDAIKMVDIIDIERL